MGGGEAGAAMGPGLSVAEALRSRAAPPYLVSGHLWKSGDRMQLCTTIEMASPPRCGGPSLRVRGLELARFTGLRTAGATTWSEQPVQLLGDVKDGAVTAAGKSQG